MVVVEVRAHRGQSRAYLGHFIFDYNSVRFMPGSLQRNRLVLIESALHCSHCNYGYKNATGAARTRRLASFSIMAVFSNNVSMQDVDAPPIAVLYITHMKTTSACSPELRSSTHPTVLIDNRDVGTPALEIRLYPWVSILEPLCLVVFGTDPEQCTIVLADTEGISPVHCKLHLQLNTEGNVWLVEDCSGQNTAYCDDEGLISNTHQVVSSGRRASVGIHSIGIGPYVFCCQLPNSDAETAKLREFRRRNEPIPVTGEILDKQLNGVSPRFYHMQLLGSGGFGKVFKAMEKHTGLVIAIKQQTVKDDKRVQREMGSMKELSHV